MEGQEAVGQEEVKEVKVKALTKAQKSQAEADAVTWQEDMYFGPSPYKVLSRAAAVLLGFSRYYLGRPCLNGHDSPRKTKTATCLACSREKLRERHKNRIKEDAGYKAKFAAKAKARRLAKKKAATTVAAADAPESEEA